MSGWVPLSATERALIAATLEGRARFEEQAAAEAAEVAAEVAARCRPEVARSFTLKDDPAPPRNRVAAPLPRPSSVLDNSPVRYGD